MIPHLHLLGNFMAPLCVKMSREKAADEGRYQSVSDSQTAGLTKQHWERLYLAETLPRKKKKKKNHTNDFLCQLDINSLTTRRDCRHTVV